MLTNTKLKENCGTGIKQFIVRGRTDFRYFCAHLFNADIQDFHLEWADSYVNNKRTCIISFRGSGKSYIAAVLIPLWLMFYERNLTFLNVSSTQRQSYKIIDEMRKCIRETELLQMLVPKDNSYRWTRQEINTTTGCKMVSVPYTDNARGYHVDYLLVDEAQNMKDTTLFSSVFVPMVQHKDGAICLIGTMGSETDLLAEKQLPQSGYNIFRYPILNDETSLPVWPTKFSAERIEEIKKDVGLIPFAREYLLENKGVAGQAIDPACLVHSLDETLRFSKVIEPGSQVFMGTDLATSPIGDYTAIAFVEKTKGGQFVLRWIERHRGRTVQNQGQIIADRYNIFKPHGTRIDISQIGPGIVQDLRNNYSVNMTPFQFTNVSRNAIFNKLISAFGEYDMKNKVVRGGNLIIPRDVKDPYTATMSGIIINEISGLYPAETLSGQPTFKTSARHDDLLCSVAMAIDAATRVKKGIIYAKSYR